MAVMHLDASNFEEKAMKAPLALVDFWASWCGPCKMIAPAVEAVAEEMEGKVVVAKVDVDSAPTLAQQYGVMSIPTLIVLKDGVEVGRQVGVVPAEALSAMLAEHL